MAPVMHCCTACAENSSPERGHSPNSPSDGKTLRFTGSAAVFLDFLTGYTRKKPFSVDPQCSITPHSVPEFSALNCPGSMFRRDFRTGSCDRLAGAERVCCGTGSGGSAARRLQTTTVEQFLSRQANVPGESRQLHQANDIPCEVRLPPFQSMTC
jgi:hypothetical protein